GGDARLARHVGEGAVAVVVVQNVFAVVEAEAGDVDVGQPVVVVIADGDAPGVDALVEPAAHRDVGEGAVAVVAEEAAAAADAGEKNVEVAVAVEVEHGAAAAAAGLVEADAGSDLLEAHAGGMAPGGHLQAVLGRRRRRVAAVALGGEPGPVL